MKVVKAKSQNSQGRRARHTRTRKLDVRGSQTPFARHDKHGSGDLDKLDIRRNREVVSIVLDARQNENGNAGFCNIRIANLSIFKELIALFCQFFSLCPHILPYKVGGQRHGAHVLTY